MSEVAPCTTLLIRCDSTTSIGTGHIMRCIALAQAWQDRGGSVTFLSHCESNDLRQRILDEGFEFIATEKPHPDPSDLKRTLSILTNKTNITNNPGQANNSWLILDGYHFDTAYQKAIRNAGYRSVVIDDMNHLPHYHADILLNQNISAPTFKYSCDEDTIRLLGCKYALLRREFLRYRNWQRKVPEKATRILVTLGGADPDNVTLKVIWSLNRIDVPALEVKFIVGPANPHGASLEREIKRYGFPVELLSSVEDMPGLMAWADMAISAGGSTCWELAYMGVPMLVVVLRENQNGVAKGLNKAGAGINLGWHEDVSVERLNEELQRVMSDPRLRAKMSRLGRQLVDGRGAARVVFVLRGDGIYLRPVREEDCKLVWRWANDPEARRFSFHSDSILWEDHEEWFAGKLRDPNCVYYIAMGRDGAPVGQIRFDVSGENAEVSVSIDSERRASGSGSWLIEKGIERLVEETSARYAHAFIKKNNTTSIKAFRNAGFIEHGEKIVEGCRSVYMAYETMLRTKAV